MSYDIQAVIRIALSDVGYSEKKSNKDLYSKTGNAGKGNYVKMWAELKPSYQGQSWCDAAVSYWFYKAYGKEGANNLLCGGLYSFYTPSSAQLYKNKGQWHTGSDVKRGDQIFFKNSQRIHHTGLVVDVKNGRIYTVEGNTSNGTAVVPNGGMVCHKSYPIGLSTIAGYGRPNYGTQSSAPKPTAPTRDWLQLGDKGASVTTMQKMLIACGYSCGKAGADGDFGNGTLEALKKFQKANGLAVDGYYGKGSKAKLEAVYAAKTKKPTSNGKTGVTTTTLNVRIGAGTNHAKCKTFGPIRANEKVVILKTVKGDDGDTWYFVEYKGKKGYCCAKYVRV